jgi:hypothetical protein
MGYHFPACWLFEFTSLPDVNQVAVKPTALEVQWQRELGLGWTFAAVLVEWGAPRLVLSEKPTIRRRCLHTMATRNESQIVQVAELRARTRHIQSGLLSIGQASDRGHSTKDRPTHSIYLA